MIQLPILYEKDGKQLVLSIGVHMEAKELLKMFAFLQKSVTNLPSTRRGDGMIELWRNFENLLFEKGSFSKIFLIKIMLILISKMRIPKVTT